MAVNLSPIGGVAAQFFDNSGNPLTGGKIYTYTAGTTTPQATYTSANGATAHSNPIILDAAGRVPSGEIWLTDGLQYKFLIKTSTDVQIGSYDNIVGINSNFVNYTSSQEFQTATAGQTVFTLTTMQYQPGTNSLSVFVDGVNQYGPGALYAYTETSSTVVTFTSGLHVGADVKFTTTAINSSAAADAEQVGYIPPFTGSVATNVEAKLAQYVSVKDFGAVGDGANDDTAEIQAAINRGQLTGQSVYLPAGNYLVTTSLQITSPVTLFGDGWGSCIYVSSSFSASSDVIWINPSAYSENIVIKDLSIRPVSGTPARYGIAVDIRNYGVSYCEFSGIRIAALGDYCFAVIPNATPLLDGFFTSVIDRCAFFGGIKLDKAGDSLRITNNTITGPRIGIYVDLLNGPFDGGPHGLLIDGNNITSNGGALYVLNCTMGVFSNNNVELPTPSGVTNNAMIDLEGINSFSFSVNGMAIINNFLGSAIPGYDTIRVNYGRNVLIFGNYVSHPLSAYSYRITANATGTRIIQNDDALDATYGTLVSDAGAGTLFMRTFGGELQQTNNIRFLTGNKTIKWQDSAGTATSCLQLSSADDFFYVGPDGATALTGGMIFRLNGAEVGRWTPTGNMNVTGAGKGVTLKSPDGLMTKTLTINNAGTALVLI